MSAITTGQDGALELTPLQQSMYAAAALTDRPWHYVEQIVVHLAKEWIDADAMARAWGDVVAAHPGLRMAIIATGAERPVQRVSPPFDIMPVVQDWTAHAPDKVDGVLQAFLAQDRVAGVDATVAPAFRVAVFHIGPAQSKLVWSFPHTLLDGRSFAPLLDAVFQRYQRIMAGDGPVVVRDAPDLFAAHCTALAQMSHTAGQSHFAKHLAGWEGTSGLVQAGVEAGRKAEQVAHLDEDQTAALKQLATAAGVSISSVILAAWGVVLARATGQDDVVLGNTRNGRHVVEGTGDVAGCFITTVPMRVQLRAGLTVGDLLRRVHADQIAARPFEHTPLPLIARRLDIAPQRRIFDSVVMFDYGTLDEQIKALNPAWATRRVELYEEGDTPVSVAAYMGARLKVVVEYDPAQVPQGAGLAAHLMTFLAALGGATPQTPLAAVSMLTQAQTAGFYELAGPEHGPGPTPTCLAQFQANAAKTPGATALVQPGQGDVTYGALDDAAAQVAARLHGAGVQPGDVVGICMARSAAFVTAMLGIWKAGAAFVPMDPTYPVATLNIIAQDSGARLVMTDAAAPALDAVTVDAAQLAAGRAKPVRHGETAGDALAYVIFTSGSTGRPKGVMVSHRSLAAHAAAIVPFYGLQRADRVLQFAALSFDVALEETIPTLASGATLVLRSDEMAQSVPDFLEQCGALGITVANLPTGFWVALTEVLDSRNIAFPPAIRLMVVGGERVPMSVLRRWRARLPEVRWVNGYGPTEATITCTAHEITAQDLAGQSVPIGRPLAHARAWVLGADGGLLAMGGAGELFISGLAVAQGYVGDPARTAASFTKAAFDPQVGRIYATGDRVMWHDGVLHYLGRMDRQIKLRGFRIEPGQVEAALEAQAGIDRAHAAVVTPKNGQPMLVAWYSATKGNPPPSEETVQGWMTRTLPPQMRPVLVAVADWPQTPGGKVDVKRLPSPSSPRGPVPGSGAVTEDANDAGETPLTQEVAVLFEKVLGAENIGPATSFFEAGGDSLSLLRLLPELETRFDVRLKPTAIYSDPTPRGVVRALLDQDPDPLVVIPVQPEGDLPPLYAVHVLGNNGSFFRPLAAVLGRQQPVFGLTVGLLSENTPTSVVDIARFYLHQIERHHPVGPLSLVAVSAGSYVTLELAQQLLAAGRDVRALILLDAEGPGGRARVGGMARIAIHLRQFTRQGWPYVANLLAAKKELRNQDAAQLRLQSGTENEVAGEDITGVADFVAANMLAIEAYVPQPYPRRLTIYRAGDSHFDSADAIETGLGWKPLAAAGFDISDVPGDHLGLLEAPNVDVLGARIADLLGTDKNG